MKLGSLYVIAVGGTGARCVEAIVQLAAAGLFPQGSIRVFFIDPDLANGNLQRTRDSMRIYQRCYQLLPSERLSLAWMSTEIESLQPDVISSFGNISTNQTLGSFFNYDYLLQTDPPLAKLFDVLYSQEERETNLNAGFGGRPAIGSAIMSQSILEQLEEEKLKLLSHRIQQDLGSGGLPKIILCGSTFGGTGAALPLVARLLRRKIEEYTASEEVKIAGLLLLPYFQFAQPAETGSTGRLQTGSEQFLSCTEGVLRYSIGKKELFDLFDIVYLLGNPHYAKYQYRPGGSTQCNPAHFVELYGALAARHFWLNPPQNRGKVALMRRDNNRQVTWDDLPERAMVKDKLTNATRFAYVWLTNIVPELTTAQEIGVSSFQERSPWFVEFFRPSQEGLIGRILGRKWQYLPDFREQQQLEAVEVITQWCKDYLRWLVEIHQCDGEEIKLFNYSFLANTDNDLNRGHLADLIIDDARVQRIKARDTVQRLKEKLNSADLRRSFPHRQAGTLGLATSLYVICRL